MFGSIVFSTFQKGKIQVDDYSTWVSLCISLLWSVNHSFHKRNKNYFSTWVSLDISVSVFHSCWHLKHDDSLAKYPYTCLPHFHNINKNDFSTWVYLGIFLLWSVNHSFHKRIDNDFFSLVSFKHDDSLAKYPHTCLPHFHNINENDFSTWV